MIAPLLGWAKLPHFTPQLIASDLRGGYQVVAADVNRDGKLDLIALASGVDELVWYENPSWTRRVVAGGLKRMINCVVIGDEIVVAHGFENEAARSIGIVSLLQRGKDPLGPWNVREIDRLTTSHRLRVAQVGGRAVVINAPLTGASAKAPDYRDRVPLVYYVPGEWKRQTIEWANEGVQHGIFIDGRSILTASFSGIHRFEPTPNGWKRTEVSKGDPSPCPKCGASDVAVARDGSMAAIEPWHGNQVVVYRKGLPRKVIDDSLTDAHSIATADLDGDRQDEIIVAQRGAPGRVLIYRGTEKTVLDEGITAASCIPVDLDGDRRIDIACIGSASHNLKVYWNRKSAPVRVALVGDSTVNDEGGWGPGFRAALGPGIEVRNHAMNGRSSKSFRDEGRWEPVLTEKPMYVLIQFGHNDQPGKGPERETDPDTTYRANLERYIAEARAAGATPVLATSIVRRNFDGAELRRDALERYAAAVRKVAAERKTPLMDLYALTFEQTRKLGQQQADTLGATAADGKPDRTHLGTKGRQEIGRMAALELVKGVPALKRYLFLQ